MAFLKRRFSLKGKSANDVGKNLDKPLLPARNVPIPPPKTELADVQANTTKPHRPQSDRARSANVQSRLERAEAAARDREREADAVKIEIEADGALFAFPTPSPMVSPAVPPKSASIASAQASPLGANPPTPSIGQTVGSATGRPTSRRCSKTTQNVPTVNRLQQPPMPARAKTGLVDPSHSMRRVELRKKKSSWRSFGGIFSRKNAATPLQRELLHPHYVAPRAPPCSPLQAHPLLEIPQSPSAASTQWQTISSSRTNSHLSTDWQNKPETQHAADKMLFIPSPSDKREVRLSRSVSSLTRTYSPPIHPNNHISHSDIMAKPSPGRRDSQTRVDITRAAQTSLTALPQLPGASPVHTLPSLPLRLDLDIPSCEMERYSVMFETLLKPRQSIAARRRSRSRKSLSRAPDETVSDVPSLPSNVLKALVKPLKPVRSQRSLSSSRPQPVPSLTIKVDKKDHDSKINNQQRTATAGFAGSAPLLQRSMTAPHGSKPPVSHGATHPRRGTVNSHHAPVPSSHDEGEPGLSPSSLLNPENSLPPTPSTASFADGDEADFIGTCAPISRHNHNHSQNQTQPHNTNHDPPPSPAPSIPARSNSPVSPCTLENSLQPRRSVRGKPLSPVFHTSQDLEERIVQVSVARQVSVSRARRHVERAASMRPLAQELKPRVVEVGGWRERRSMVVSVEGSVEGVVEGVVEGNGG